MATTAASVTTAHSPFQTESSSKSLGYNLPQRLGVRLALPMFFMAVMFFAAGIALAVIRSGKIADGADADTIAMLQHLGAAFMFLGFASVFGAISFAIARILGQFRKGGGEVQESTGRTVQTLKTPTTAKVFLAGMMMAMGMIVVPVILHFLFAAGISNTPESLETSEERFLVLEGIRRFGVATFLFSITLGLATIITVLRFQATRLRELVKEPPTA